MLPRLVLFTLILFCLEMGVFLVVLPWSELWELNFFLFRYPALATWLLDFRVRGGISGLGLLDIGLAMWYAAHYQAVLARWHSGAPAASASSSSPTPAPESYTRGQTA